MFGSLSRKAWLGIAAVVAVLVAAVVVVVLVAGGDDDEPDVATGTTGASTAASTPATTSEGTAGEGTTSSAGTATSPPTTCDDPEAPGEVTGRRDLDGDGTDELFVVTGAGASTDIIGLFRVEGCEAVQVSAGGAPAEYPVGATVRNISGLHASGDSLVVYSGTSVDGQSFDVAWRTLRYDGGALTEVTSESGSAQLGDELYTLASTFGA